MHMNTNVTEYLSVQKSFRNFIKMLDMLTLNTNYLMRNVNILTFSTLSKQLLKRQFRIKPDNFLLKKKNISCVFV